MESNLTNPISEITYAVTSTNLVWIVHLIVALVFLAIGAVYYYYKDKDDSKDLIKNMDQGIYTLLMVLGGLMFLWHGHLFVVGNNIPNKIIRLIRGRAE